MASTLHSHRVSSNVYASLSPHERFHATLLAMSRGDSAEAIRLASLCPNDERGCRDARFTRRLEVASYVTMYFCLDVTPSLVGLKFTPALMLAHEALMSQSDECDADELPQEYAEVKTSVQAVIAGFSSFCDREVGLPMEHMLAAFHPRTLELLRVTGMIPPTPTADMTVASASDTSYSDLWAAGTMGFNSMPQ